VSLKTICRGKHKKRNREGSGRRCKKDDVRAVEPFWYPLFGKEEWKR